MSLPPSAVARGAKALAQFNGIVRRTDASGRHALHHEPQAAAVLTAALRLDDPETVERVARAIFCNWFAGGPVEHEAWDRLSLKDPWLKLAEAVLLALLGAEPE